MSVIPIYGMVHRIDVKSLTEGDDGAGGISVSEEVKLSDIRCRITVLNAEDVQKEFGLASGRMWKVICRGIPSIVETNIIYLSKKSKTAPIDEGIAYKVIRVKKQIDQNGSMHHLSLAIEKEEKDG